MPYLLKSRDVTMRMRDGVAAGDPVYEVTTGAWVPFENLPESLRPRYDEEPTGDGQIVVRVVDSIVDVPKGKLMNRAPPEPVVDVADEEPAGLPGPARLSQTVDKEKLARHMALTNDPESAPVDEAITAEPEPSPEPSPGSEPSQRQKKKSGRRRGR